MSRISQLQSMRAKAIADARNLVEEAERQGRKELDGADNEAYNRATDEVARLDAAIVEARKQELVANVTREGAAKFAGDGRSQSTNTGSEFRSLLEPINPEGGHLNRTVTLPIESRLEYPLLASDTGSQSYGGYAVGRSIYPSPVTAMVSESGILQAGPLVIRTTSGEQMDVPYVASSGLPDAAYRLEGVDAAEATIALSHVETIPKDIAGYCQVSEEWFSDAAIADAEGFVSGLIGKGLGVELATELSQGAGTTALSGMFNASVGTPTGVTAATTNGFTMGELLALRASVSAANRNGAKFIFTDYAYSHLLLLTDDAGQYLLQPSTSAAPQDTLFGYSVFVDAYGPTVAATNHVAVFGRIEDAYVVRFVGGLTIESSDAPGYLKWVRTFRYRVRVAAMPLSSAAAAALVMKA